MNWKLLLLAVAVYLLFMRKRKGDAPQNESAAGHLGDFDTHRELMPVDERHMGTVPDYYFLNGEGPTASA